MSARELMTDYLEAARRGDWETAYGWFAEDMTIRVPGSSQWAGEHRGKEHAVRYIESARQRYAGRIELELIEMLAGEERVALLVRERFDGVEIRRANVYTVRAGKIVEIAIFEGDQYAVDALLHGHQSTS